MRARRYLLPLVIIVIVVVVFMVLKGSRSTSRSLEPAESVWTVQALELRYGDIRPTLELYGQIIAGSEVELRASVKGRVDKVYPAFREGAIARQGELLLSIDEIDFLNAVNEREAGLKQAEARLDEFRYELEAERKLLANAGHEVDLRKQDVIRYQNMSNRGTVAQKALDDSRLALIQAEQATLRHRQTIKRLGAQIKQQEAVIGQLEVALKTAKRELQRTAFKAPFDGFVVDAHAGVGSWLTPGEKVGRIINAQRLEVRFRLGESDYARLMNVATNGGGSLVGRQIKVFWRRGGETLEFAAEVERTGGEIKPGDGGVSVYARILDSGMQTLLRPGAFVEIALPDELFSRVAQVPADALIAEDSLFFVAGDRVELHPVKIVHRNGDEVFIQADRPRDQPVVLKPPPELGPGSRVKFR